MSLPPALSASSPDSPVMFPPPGSLQHIEPEEMLENPHCSLSPEPSVNVAMCPLRLCFLSLSLLRSPFIYCSGRFYSLCHLCRSSSLIGDQSAALRPQPERRPLSFALSCGCGVGNRFSSVARIRSGIVTLLSVMTDRKKGFQTPQT